jgi:uncharacterized protein DUF4124
MTRLLLAAAFLLVSGAGYGQIYKWTDANGRVNFSNTPPPKGANATVVDPSASAGPPAAESTECYTIRCQGERMEERQRKRQTETERMAAERVAAAPKAYRGLEFRKYLSIQRGMSEGELLGVAGEPDMKADQGIALSAPVTIQLGPNHAGPGRAGLSMKTYTYMPTPGDPFTTTIRLVGGRVDEIERVRKF